MFRRGLKVNFEWALVWDSEYYTDKEKALLGRDLCPLLLGCFGSTGVMLTTGQV